MTIPEGSPPRPSPWLSVWFHPGRTIQQILATDPKRHVLLLAALYAILAVLTWSVGVFAGPWGDWRVIAALAVAAVIAGIAYLYIMGLFLALSGLLVGGRASATAMRAALAWSLVPPLCGLAVYLVIAVIAELSGLATAPTRNALEAAAGASLVVLSLWSWIIAWRMVACVLGFGFWRTAIAILAAVIMLSMASALAVRTLLFQPFSMPSASMEPTLLVGDRFFVSKFSYGFSHYSLPFSPRLFAGRLLASDPGRGDVVVFRLPKDDSIDYVKRVVGLPGDTIQMIDGVLHINGQPVKRERAPDFVDDSEQPPVRVKRWRETLPNGVSYDTLQLYETGLYDNTPPYVVPAGNLFMLGDNRQNLQDSRVLAAVGYIPLENLIGRVEIIFLSLDQRAGQPGVRSERLGQRVR
jgi:signal peptidase I